MRKLSFLGLIVFFILILIAIDVGAVTRIALVIGNSKYQSSPLKNPVNDANAIADILKTCGFEVTTRFNMDQIEMKKAINLFGNRMSNGSVALFYYSGHGMQVNGTNFLIPIGAKIHSETDVDIESVNVNRVLAKMASVEKATNILILDACRDNPFSRGFRTKQSGLAYMNAPTGTIVAYSTAPGSIASDGDGKYGIYTEELINFLLLPDIKIEDVFKRVRVKVAKKSNNKQIPWESSSLMGDFYFSIKNNTPNQVSFSLDDLNSSADKLKKDKKLWEQYNTEMIIAFNEVKSFLKLDIDVEKKIVALKRFLNEFGQNNPYSQDDNKLRELSKKQIVYWKNNKPVSEKHIRTGMTIKEVRTILGAEKSFDTCGDSTYLYYKDRWIWFSSGILKGYIPIESWKGPCYSASYSSRYGKFVTAKSFINFGIETGMTIKEVRTILGAEKSFDTCGDSTYLYYKDRWIWFSSGILKGYIPIESWKGPCYSASYSSRYGKF